MLFRDSAPFPPVRNFLRPRATKHSKTWYAKHIGEFARRNKNDENPIQEAFRQCTAPRTRPNSTRSRPKGVPGAFRTLPGRFRDGPGAVSGLPRTVPRRLVRAPGPFRSLPGRFRMILDRSKLPQNDFSSIFRRILDVFSSIWARFGFDFLRDLVRRPARLSFRFSGFAGPPRYVASSADWPAKSVPHRH